MKNEIRLALLCLAATTAPAFAQNALPQCGSTNFDQTRNIFTISNPAAGTTTQQCLITVYQRGAVPDQSRQSPAPYFIEGNYVVELSGGGGGGSGGASKNNGGGGGGGGAVPSRTAKYLAPGVYKLTIGTGGEGGGANGGLTGGGYPTSLTNANTGELIYGFPGADNWRQGYAVAGEFGGVGGPAVVGGSRGGNGGDSGPRAEESAQAGGMSQTVGFSGRPGKAGSDSSRSSQANAGGGGGAGVGDGGDGQSENSNTAAGIGDLGGGGGGGRGGENTADAGGRGGHGFIRLAASEPAPQAFAPVTGAVGQSPVIERVTETATNPASTATRPARMDRN